MYLAGIIPIPINMGAGGDPDYFLGGLIVINLIIIFCYIVRFIQLLIKRDLDFRTWLGIDYDNTGAGEFLIMSFIAVNGIAFLIWASIYVTDHFIKNQP